MKDVDITGKRFNRLVAIKFVKKIKNSGSFWLCKCDCGNEVVVRIYDLYKGLNNNKGGTKSCGCLDLERKRIEKGKASFNRVLGTYKNGAKNRGIFFGLDEQQFRKLTSDFCYYCGSKPRQIPEDNANRNGIYVYNGIDRINNDLGYVIDNCVSCCKVCNRAKLNMGQQEFLSWINGLVVYRNLLSGQ